jgi:hypothetical protein
MGGRLGFDRARDVVVWSLPALRDGVPRSESVDPDVAQTWIAAHRESREPWQRADESVARIRPRGAAVRARVVDRDGEIAAAVVFRDDAGLVTMLQIAALDDHAAAEALLVAAGPDRGLRLSNAPVGETPARALERLGARPLVRQHEMRLVL